MECRVRRGPEEAIEEDDAEEDHGEDTYEDDDNEMASLSAAVEELEAAFAVVDVADLSEEEMQTFAAEAQRVVGAVAAKGRGRGKGGPSSSNYSRQRQFIKYGKARRAEIFDEAIPTLISMARSVSAPRSFKTSSAPSRSKASAARAAK